MVNNMSMLLIGLHVIFMLILFCSVTMNVHYHRKLRSKLDNISFEQDKINFRLFVIEKKQRGNFLEETG